MPSESMGLSQGMPFLSPGISFWERAVPQDSDKKPGTGVAENRGVGFGV